MLASGVNTLAQEASNSHALELARRALANYEVRQAHAADYTWREEWATQMSVQGKKSKYKVFPTSRFDEYEVIPVVRISIVAISGTTASRFRSRRKR